MIKTKHHLNVFDVWKQFSDECFVDELVKKQLSHKRYLHCKEVTKVCIKLAKQHGVDVHLAFLAGMLHDITKELSKEESVSYMQYYKEYQYLKAPLYHQYTAIIFLKQKYNFYNKKVFHAIMHHTLGTGTSKLAKILFIADKIEPTRGYDTTYHMKLALRNLELGFAYVKAENQKYLKERGVLG